MSEVISEKAFSTLVNEYSNMLHCSNKNRNNLVPIFCFYLFIYNLLLSRIYLLLKRKDMIMTYHELSDTMLKNFIEHRPELMNTLEDIIQNGGRPGLIGGYVRDIFMRHFHGMEIKEGDVDVEVAGIKWGDLKKVLKRHGKLGENGASFTILNIKLDGDYIDFSVPREERKSRETKDAMGRRAFHVKAKPDMSDKEAAERRDYTINAIKFDLIKHEFVDPFNGIEDIKAKKLKPVSDRFSEDALRILRGMRLAAKFGLTLDKNYRNVKIIQAAGQRFEEISMKRLWDEWEMWALTAFPSYGLQFLQDCGMLWWFPELEAMQGVPQNPKWHPEGDCWQHLKQTVDCAARVADRDNLSDVDRSTLVFILLCHDLGKPLTTVFKVKPEKGAYWGAPGHAPAGAEPARNFLHFMEDVSKKDFIVFMVIHHMDHDKMENSKNKESQVRDTAMQMPLQWLAWVAESDQSGRNHDRVIRLVMPETMQEMLDIASVIDLSPVVKLKRILSGDELNKRNLKQGPQFREILDASIAAQIAGEFVDAVGAVAWLDKWMEEHSEGLVFK